MADVKQTKNWWDYRGLGFDDALNKTFAMRDFKRSVYGDSWKTAESWEIAAQVKNKIGRYVLLMFNPQKEKLYESKIDTAVDLCVYSLFLLQKTLEEEESTLTKEETKK